MNNDELKRLEKLKKFAKQGVLGDSFLKGDALITVFDLHLLLLEDETTRRLIQEICKKPSKKSKEERLPESKTDGAGEDGHEPLPLADHGALMAAQAEIVRLTQALDAEKTQSTALQNQMQAQMQALQLENTARTAERNALEHQLKAVPPPQPPDALRGQLAPELALLLAVQADEVLQRKWLLADEPEGRQLVRLVANLSDWDEVLVLWSEVADRCKTEKRKATPNEHAVLQAALALHNQRFQDRAAQMASVEMDAPFHHETMERGNPKGSTVVAVWWPGLRNAAGELNKKPVVQTH